MTDPVTLILTREELYYLRMLVREFNADKHPGWYEAHEAILRQLEEAMHR